MAIINTQYPGQPNYVGPNMDERTGNMLYRIYTEDKHYVKTIEIVEEFFSGYTVYNECLGGWHGVQENSLVIEIIAPHDKLLLVKALAQAIKQVNQQVAVTVTVQPVTVLVV